MATTSTYTLLQRVSIRNGTASITFSSIPQSGYTDLVAMASMRSSRGAAPDDGLNLRFNGESNQANITGKDLYGAGSGTPVSFNPTESAYVDAGTATANTFASYEFYFPNYLSSTQKSYSVTGVTENNASSALADMRGMLWSGTAAINQLTFLPANGEFTAGSTISLYGVSALGTTPGTPKALGGDIIVNDGTYWYHAFLNTGSFAPFAALSCNSLVIAGGGAGGNNKGGGGGAGGLVYTTSQSLSAQSYSVLVGAGGANKTSGNNSAFFGITAIGGGYGGTYDGTANPLRNGGNGGSGGGGSTGDASPNTTGGTATSGQGNNGGIGLYSTSGSGTNAAGGGGGAGAAGANGVSGSSGGAGGAGVNTYSSWATATKTGVSGYYAGGGGGGAWGLSGGAGGAGGGGAGSDGATPGWGMPSTGSGGGGVGQATATGGYGGSGIVIIRYAV
jgi:hypothetical protein